MQTLCDIIRIQQRRLRMMLTGKRLHDSQMENSQQQVFFDWLEGQQQWHDRLAQQLVDETGEQNPLLST